VLGAGRRAVGGHDHVDHRHRPGVVGRPAGGQRGVVTGPENLDEEVRGRLPVQHGRVVLQQVAAGPIGRGPADRPAPGEGEVGDDHPHARDRRALIGENLSEHAPETPFRCRDDRAARLVAFLVDRLVDRGRGALVDDTGGGQPRVFLERENGLAGGGAEDLLVAFGRGDPRAEHGQLLVQPRDVGTAQVERELASVQFHLVAPDRRSGLRVSGGRVRAGVGACRPAAARTGRACGRVASPVSWRAVRVLVARCPGA
jgi:hypothetical protein